MLEVYGFYKKQPAWAVLVGSIVYTFSGTMYVAFTEPFFMNPMYIFPFVMVGVEKLLKENKAVVYVTSLAFMFINYFYFAYMTAILIVIYFILSFIFDKDLEKSLSYFFKSALKFAVYSIIAMGISAVFLLPILLVVAKINRIGLDYDLSILYPKNHYKRFMIGLIAIRYMPVDCYIGYGAISIPCIAMLFSQRKQHTKLKVEYILATLGLCIPLVGKIFNGMSYCANKWLWAYALIVAYIVTLTISQIKDCTKKQKYFMLGISICYFILVEVLLKNNTLESNSLIGLLLICSFFFVISSSIPEKYYKLCCIGLAAFSMILPASFYFRSSYSDGTNGKVDFGTAYSSLTQNGGMNLLEKVYQNDGSRYEQIEIGRIRNQSWLYGISGFDFYISLYNNNIDTFHNDIALYTHPWVMGYHGLNRRTELDALFGVKYYVTYAPYRNHVPYGYTELKGQLTADGYDYEAYQPKEDYQIVYGFEKSIGYSDFEKMSILDRNQAIMKAVVLDDEKANTKSKELNLENIEAPYEIINYNDNIKINKNEIQANIISTEENNEIQLKFDPISNSEVWILVEGIDYAFEESNTYYFSTIYKDQEQKDIKSTVMRLNNKSHMYGGKHNIIVNLGKIENEIDYITFRFDTIGNYTIKDIKLVARSEEQIMKSINGLNHIAKDIKFENNQLSFTATLDKPQNVFISVPYSSGWKATVNGKEVEILKADDAFMVLQLEEGTYDIELKYKTPGLLSGLVISLLSITGTVILIKKKVLLNI